LVLAVNKLKGLGRRETQVERLRRLGTLRGVVDLPERWGLSIYAVLGVRNKGAIVTIF